ncbi:ethanolamine ammonia-lyase [Granulicella sp. 5B5]|nr:ethanolamine ammonia-lyase [Granulicella sp. 5B5]
MADTTPSRLTIPQLATPARLSLGNTSPAISTADHLRFQLDHAQARDAVHTPLDLALLTEGLRDRKLQPVHLRSAAPNRAAYLRRPDLGRTLHPDSIEALHHWTTKDVSSRPEVRSTAAERPASPSQDAISPTNPTPSSILYPLSSIPCSPLILLADGLSALALERHALPLLDATLPLLPTPYSLLPVLTNARVALADPIGELLSADITILLIGERPGLSSPDSLGVYITWAPRPGRTDAERNCISNIRGSVGLSYNEAAHRIAHYLREAARLHTTGITLKDPAPTLQLP